MGISEDLAKRIADAKATTRGNPIKDGKYILLIEKLFVEKKYKGTIFIGEFEVVLSEKTEPDVEPNAPKSKCSVAFNLDKNESAAGNAKQLVLGLVGKDEATTTGEEFVKILADYVGDSSANSAQKKARGMYVECNTYRNTTQKGPNVGKVGTYPRFSAVATDAGNSEDEVKQRRAELDKAAAAAKK